MPTMLAIAESDLTIEQLATANKAAGDPLRLSILRLLEQGAFGVMELSQIFEVKQSGMSHHLKVLSQAGLVNAQREGNSIFYRRPLLSEAKSFSQWLLGLFRTLDAAPLSAYVTERVSTIMAERATACAEFFARHADDFREQQDLIASYEHYGDALSNILNSLGLKNSQYALEIGPGEGAFLPQLASHFEHVVGIDISPDMLAKAQDLCSQQVLTNVALLNATTGELTASHPSRFGFAVANMVMHHVPSPKTIFTEVAQLLEPGGVFLVTDLCRHEQTWAKESCGDLWLGFEPEDLTRWAAAAGLTEGQSQFSGLRNGFQIQFRLFQRS
jgi:ubiquinone/menaquinone biosynthesis C-methylase UbiE